MRVYCDTQSLQIGTNEAELLCRELARTELPPSWRQLLSFLKVYWAGDLFIFELAVTQEQFRFLEAGLKTI